ncbi:membrane protein insertase YidC [Thermoproteota archaeon]
MFKQLIDSLMIPSLSFLYHNVIPNYGVAIIIMTLIIKVVFYPLTKKQFEAMKAQQKVQPLMQKMREKYKEQPEKLQQEMMRLWKEHKVNPLSGCLPILVQIPVFILMFMTIKSESFKLLLTQPGINPGLFPFWLPNLSMPDTTYILPVLVAFLTFVSQKMTITDKKQAAMFMFFPLMMLFFCLKMPSGVVLYWAIQQGVSTLQQMMIMKKPAKELIEQ